MEVKDLLFRVLRQAAEFPRRVRKLAYIIRWKCLSGKHKYIYMQKVQYHNLASMSEYASLQKVDYVVGSYDAHNHWPDYDLYLMKYVDESFRDKVALDFACGPGRNIIKYQRRFARIDGADVCQKNLQNLKANLAANNIQIPNLYVTNGHDLGGAAENFYDFIFSTIAMQHICVYEIRFDIFTAMYKSLKHGGRISIQMGFGANAPHTVDYYENNYSASGTNRACDVRIASPDEVRQDLERIGFKEFEYWIRPVGPGDCHPNWIFFTALK